MTIVAVVEAAALLAVVFLFLRDRSRAERAAFEERRELLTRIQHPQVIPHAPAREFVIPDPEPDEIDLVGVVQEPSEADLLAAD